MLAENAERRRAAPISSATAWKMFLDTSRHIASGSRRLAAITPRALSCRRQMDLAIKVHSSPPAGRNQRRGAVLGDNGGSREPFTRVQPLPFIDGDPLLLFGKMAVSDGGRPGHRSLSGARQLWQIGARRDSGGAAPHADDFDGTLRVRVAISTFMGAMKGRDVVAIGRDAQIVRLAYIAQVQAMFEALLAGLESLPPQKGLGLPLQSAQEAARRLAGCVGTIDRQQDRLREIAPHIGSENAHSRQRSRENR